MYDQDALCVNIRNHETGDLESAEHDLLRALVDERMPWKIISSHINSILHGNLTARNSSTVQSVGTII